MASEHFYVTGRKKEVIIMKIRVEFDFNEMVMFKEMIHVALKCAAKGGLEMDKPIDEQIEEVSNFVGDGTVEKEFDSFLVVNFFEGVTEIFDRIGVWVAQTIDMAKDLAKIDQTYNKYMKEYLDAKSKKKADKDAE